eukprot:CAMPEP_0174282280 /NCGR_PEP_ID=MMETSP0809-20121228/2752_1 /TAXON_ID=73025 ORGANISM="Eutreptiella gymnastica-like, Strain CCMP1594" /NCGR_SAMPLE_ID=MMETSP0809 /ASSEMBLY_ACC=CAM_ASM_000658 /LENGTH=32 /DNA_ID= /DNA_START= /DNA_END= /DNA_ORIENTATION=
MTGMPPRHTPSMHVHCMSRARARDAARPLELG